MKRAFLLPCLVLGMLLWGSVAHAEWTPITDEVEIDYQTHVIRIFVSGKDANKFKAMASKIALEYVATLTEGQDSKKMADIFKTRKVMQTKTEALLQDKIPSFPDTTVLNDGTKTAYLPFDLNALKSLFPNINLPTP
ncbi:hypothetical protein [Desulfovibrio cuneatus]|uniref:hypothetical protein n=1 Tax=Desulfovibrio cuneatus TaxID=159728 RepID=UPI000417DD32|nr:hypothetical protein [Desulfovibrio cuneatus]